MPRQISEELTRKEMIDPQLERAGWYLRDHSKVKIEIPVDGYDAEPWNGVTDYCLYRENGEVLAVVEAKGTSVSGSASQSQKTKVQQEIAQVNKVPLELKEYEDEVLYLLATQQIAIELDDGVKVNTGILGPGWRRLRLVGK